jgi:hypothetical protein
MLSSLIGQNLIRPSSLFPSTVASHRSGNRPGRLKFSPLQTVLRILPQGISRGTPPWDLHLLDAVPPDSCSPPSCQPCNPRDSRSRTVLSLSQVSNQTVKKKALSSTKFPHFISYGKRHAVAKMWRDGSTVHRPIGRVVACICSFPVSMGPPAIPTDRHGMLRPRRCATQPFPAPTATKRRKRSAGSRSRLRWARVD